MNATPVKRRLAAILAADAVGYSRMMSADEEGTLRLLAAHRALIDGIIAFHQGRIVGTAGDSVLAEFESAVESVRCAVEIQDALKTRNDSLPEGERMLFRVGVNLGDVMASGDDVHGDGVNVAARLESAADPGGVTISSSVYDQIAGKLSLSFVDIGNREFKNIARPIHVYKLAGTAPTKAVAPSPRWAASSTRRWAIGVALAAGGAVVVAWQSGWLAPAPPSAEMEARLANARAEVQEAKRRAEDEAALAAEARRQLESQRAAEAKAKAEAIPANARADTEAIRRKADVELAVPSRKGEPPKPAEPVQPPPSPAVASDFDGNWAATRSCEAFQEFPSQVQNWRFTVNSGEFVVGNGTTGQPG
jgi:class 3 adenylate cyclase